MKISEKIQRLRAENGMTQEEFGKIAGASNKAISFWEKGEKTPRLKKDQKTEAGRRDVVLLDAMAAADRRVSRPLYGPVERREESGRARQGETYGMTKRGRAFCLASFLLCCVAALAALRTIPVCQYVYILPVSVRAHRAKVRGLGEGQEQAFPNAWVVLDEGVVQEFAGADAGAVVFHFPPNTLL